ncbi:MULTISPECIES: CCGSCS motif protein [Vibrio]|uniref:CCGSCS motif protein n=1 Tax=Vibrio halioticoli NBRC 102217 TaxID=1219072 RepID=V5F3Y0_9VIBR|nr:MULTISPECIES: CCGSCS motif protein [Vibrio]MPW36002.1 CCGSCS motif protein [Vibrio sp. B1Z05]GAD89884.1 hypothetical protein VHA01S_029_00170 [Vibrio halioticoli NBRC 102217]
MTFSVKKLFAKKDEQATNAALQTQQNTETDASTEKEAPKKKHGEPGVCCGSCS